MNATTHSTVSSTAAAPATFPSSWGSRMSNRFFWGLPSTDTDTRAAETALNGRAVDEAAGRYAAAAFAHEALERVTRRSAALLQIDVIVVVLVMLLVTRSPLETGALFVPLTRWAFGLALVGCVFLASNLRLTWPSDAARVYGDPHEAYAFAMGVYKGRAWRYTVGWLLSLGALILTLVSVAQFG
jgi:hypothetical protein